MPAPESPTPAATDTATGAAQPGAMASMLLESAVLLAEMLQADYGGLAELEEQQGEVRHWISPAAGDGELRPRQQFRCGLEGSMPGYAFRTCNATICPDLSAEQRFADEALRQHGVRSGLLFPLNGVEGRFRGIGIFRREPFEYPLTDLLFVEQFLEPLGKLIEGVERRLSAPAPREATSDPAVEAPAERAAAPARSTECRSSTRHEFPYMQQIAPLYEGTQPTWEDFAPVRCADVSAGGVSLLLDSPPSFKEFVIALGRPPALTHFRARVVYVKQLDTAGGPPYHVGSRFLGRYYL